MKQTEYDKLMETLNRIDELACMSAEDNDNGEAEQLAKDYAFVCAFIDKQAKRK
jgi:hypothetical protein